MYDLETTGIQHSQRSTLRAFKGTHIKRESTLVRNIAKVFRCRFSGTWARFCKARKEQKYWCAKRENADRAPRPSQPDRRTWTIIDHQDRVRAASGHEQAARKRATTTSHRHPHIAYADSLFQVALCLRISAPASTDKLRRTSASESDNVDHHFLAGVTSVGVPS